MIHFQTLPQDQQPEKMSAKDAMMFPVIASCALFGLYLLFHVSIFASTVSVFCGSRQFLGFQFFGKEYVNYLLTAYFFVLGILSLTNLLT